MLQCGWHVPAIGYENELSTGQPGDSLVWSRKPASLLRPKLHIRPHFQPDRDHTWFTGPPQAPLKAHLRSPACLVRMILCVKDVAYQEIPEHKIPW